MDDGFGRIPSEALVEPKPFQIFIADEKIAELKQLVKLGKVAPATYESTQKEHNYGIGHQWLADAKAAWLDFDWYVRSWHIL
jgi:hypothetical protein